MVQITIALPLSVAVLVAAVGSLLLFRDAKTRGLETADMWAVGFFVAFFLLPIIGGVLVLVYYWHKINPRNPDPTIAPRR